MPKPPPAPFHDLDLAVEVRPIAAEGMVGVALPGYVLATPRQARAMAKALTMAADSVVGPVEE